MPGMKVRHREDTDLPVVKPFLTDNHSIRVARLGRLEHPLDHPALLAETDDGAFAGLLTYVPDPADGSCEILTLHTVHQWQGTGTALISAVEGVAAEQGIRRLWLITTNDNVDALRFYQRRGFRIAEIRVGGVDECRATLKPEIPEIGDYGIPIRDEIILEKHISA